MKWSWSIGRVAGIDVRIHATFLLLLGVLAWLNWAAGGTAQAVLGGLAFVLAIFGSVLAHEFGHALAARRYGIATRDITLLPIGGVARLERMPERPLQELWVALAGPLVNLGIAAALVVGLLLGGAVGVGAGGLFQGGFVERLLWANLWLVGFNLIPAFPMDGGRVLRSLLALRLHPLRATRIAARVGQGAALVFGVVGLFTSPMLVLIALFVWFGAAQEAAHAEAKAVFDGVAVGQAMSTDFRVLHPLDRLGRAAALRVAGGQRDFPVLYDGRLIGVLDRDRLLDGLRTHGRAGLVRDAMAREFDAVAPDAPLEQALGRLRDGRRWVLAVVEREQLVGWLAVDQLGDFLVLRAALRGAPSAPSAPAFGTAGSPSPEPARP
jgi:Zn-dependent protease